MLTDINIYPINNKTDHISPTQKYIFYRKKSKTKVGFGAVSGSVISRNGSEDPDSYQNESDPKHCFYLQLPECDADLVLQAVEAVQTRAPRLLSDKQSSGAGKAGSRSRAAPATDAAGYPAKTFAGYSVRPYAKYVYQFFHLESAKYVVLIFLFQ